MTIRRLSVAALVALSLSLAAGGRAEAQVRFAPTISWGDDADAALGARLLIRTSRLFSANADEGLSSRIDLVLPFDWFFDCSNCTYFEFTPGLLVPLTIKDFGPYLGAGLNVARLSVDTPGRDRSNIDLGLGLTAGLLVPVGSFHAFGEGRFTLGGREQNVFTVGLQLGATRS